MRAKTGCEINAHLLLELRDYILPMYVLYITNNPGILLYYYLSVGCHALSKTSGPCHIPLSSDRGGLIAFQGSPDPLDSYNLPRTIGELVNELFPIKTLLISRDSYFQLSTCPKKQS